MSRHTDERAIRIHQRDAALHAARLEPGQQVQLPPAAFVHLHVARGEVDLEAAGRLHEGDAVRISAGDGQRVVAHTHAELLVWEMHASAR